jgi:flavin-dependent dehydrogenase
MRIAIVGAGVAGSYLGRMLEKRNQTVEIFEMSKPYAHWPICAWGTFENVLSKFSLQAGLNFDSYILHRGKKLTVKESNNTTRTVNINGFITYDKKKWEEDLLGGLEVKYGNRCLSSTFPYTKYDYVLDCTGVHRSLLPKSAHDLILPTYEFLVECVDNMEDFFIINYENSKGYFWYFPLDSRRGYIGAGDIDKKYYGIELFFKDHPEAKVIRKIGRPIRLSPPTRMEPFYSRNIIGVGESIGCVFPATGEGDLRLNPPRRSLRVGAASAGISNCLSPVPGQPRFLSRR